MPLADGYLHIGGARTALFNWLYAHHMGGQFLLRIEDTDRARSTQAAIDAIIDGLNWLGLHWDSEIVYQSQRAERHAAVARQLVAEGRAYHCYAAPEELEAMRAEARAQGRPMRYDGRWRDRSAADAPQGVAPVVRFKAPQTGETVIEDRVQGVVRVGNEQLDDMVLLRADGTPTYMLSVVVDDHDMGVTHAIRGDDHLTNAFRQTQLFQACGWTPPVYAHIPLIHGPDGAKLSKRHGALGVDAYREMGFLPEAMRNYLLRLGWSHGDAEIISTEQAVAWFDLPAIGRGAARFDLAKLTSLNGHYMRVADDAGLAARVRPFLEQTLGRPLREAEVERLKAAMPGLKERAKTLVELAESAAFYFAQRPLPMDEKLTILMDDGARSHLAALAAVFASSTEWSAPVLEALVRDYAERHGVGLGKIAQPLRTALTGRKTSPGIFDVLAVLGRDESLARMNDQVTATATAMTH